MYEDFVSEMRNISDLLANFMSENNQEKFVLKACYVWPVNKHGRTLHIIPLLSCDNANVASTENTMEILEVSFCASFIRQCTRELLLCCFTPVCLSVGRDMGEVKASELHAEKFQDR